MSEAENYLAELLSGGVRSVVARAEDAQGRVLFELALGQARADAAGAMTSRSAFHVASVTKTMVAALLLQLVEDNLAQALDSTLGEWNLFAPGVTTRLAWREGRSFGSEISLRHLLTHTSGLLDAFEDGEPRLPGIVALKHYLMSSEALRTRPWRAWDEKRPNDKDAGVLNYYLNSGHARSHLAPPGEQFHYSDTGYVILALLIEQIARQSLGRVLEDRIFTPLGMSETYLAYAADPIGLGPSRTPESDVWLGDVPMLSAGYSLSADWGGGGVVSTARDLAIFLRALLGGALFKSTATLELMKSWVVPRGLITPRLGMGLGLQRFAVSGGEVWGHTGSWGARMLYEPVSGVIFTGTINQSEGPWDWHDVLIALARHKVEGSMETKR